MTWVEGKQRDNTKSKRIFQAKKFFGREIERLISLAWAVESTFVMTQLA